MSENPNIARAVIPAGGYESQVIDLGLFRAHRLEMPDDGWTTAPITFRVSFDGVDFDDLFLEAAEYQIATAAAGRALLLNQEIFFEVRRFIIRSGTAASPVPQLAERAIAVVKASA